LPSEYDPAGYTYRLSLFEDGRRHLVTREAITLECPVRLLHGMQDTAVPWKTSVSLAEHLKSRDVAVILVKDGDHRLSRKADLARFARVLDGLISTECSRCG
jgi:alpha-beta hydrolase superfamily lysophospholipase